ncbi:MAG TPA: TonB-dependent receptor [Steroidobacteraceae bacterium]|jgi:outer membrane receptor protein involved in Fe transport|nr:TonB-dependent receptor [Steroidobacteraceae bacterium]
MKTILAAHAALIGLLAGTAASAQQAGGPSSSNASSASNELQDIIVTAEKHSESLEKVPLSIVAYSAESLAETGVEDFSALAARIPGVTLNSAGPGQSSYSIRGIASVGGNSPTTGLYIDDTPILPSGGDGATASIDPDLFDLARVEVLRGPQGTLYGASSMGGTVRFITNQPDLAKQEAAVKAEGSYTEHGGGNGRIDAMYNVPLIDDRAALRIVGTYKNYSGFIDRDVGVWAPNPDVPAGFPAYPVSPAQPSAIVRNVNSQELYSIRTVLKVQVSDAFTVTPSVWIQDLQMGGAPDFDIPTGDSSGPLIQARPFNLSEAYSDHFVLSNLTLNYDLGWGSLLSTTSYLHRQENTPDDETEAVEDAFPQGKFIPSVYSPIITTRELTEEARLAFNPAGWALTGVAGAYFNNADRHYYVDYLTPGYAQFQNSYTSSALLSGVALNDYNYSQHGDYAPKQSAVFAELNYAITSQWKATAGLRWYDLEYTAVRYEDGWSNGGPTLSSGAAKNTGFNPKAELSYQATDDELYYASASKGVRPGGVNTSNLAAKGCGQDYGPYQPDSLWNYELGGKTRWLGGALTVNAAVYYIKWKDVQQGETLPCSYQITENAGAAVVHGGELEVQGTVSGHLQLGAGVGYAKAVLDADAPNLGGVKGEQLENVPVWNGNANAKYLFTPRDGYDAFVRADAQFVGESYPFFDRSDPATYQRAYATVDLRTGLLHEAWELNVFVTNVLDKQAALSDYLSDNYSATTRVRMFTNQPRTTGMSLRWKF